MRTFKVRIQYKGQKTYTIKAQTMGQAELYALNEAEFETGSKELDVLGSVEVEEERKM